MSCPNSQMTLYADDSTAYVSSKSITELNTKLNDEASYISRWCQLNDMVVNVNKSKVMLVTTQQKRSRLDTNLNVTLNGKNLSTVDSDKILGIQIDENLNWAKQVNSVCAKINCNLALLNRIKTYLPEFARKRFVETIISPHIEYCCTVWGGCNKVLLNKIQKLLNRAARIVQDIRRPTDQRTYT